MTVQQLRNRSWRWMLRTFVLPAGDLVFQQGIVEHLRFLDAAQWWEPDRLHAWRNKQLTALMKVAWREVPFYRALLNNARVRPEEIRRPEDLRRIPIVTRDMLRAGYPHLTTRKTGQRTREASSSGSAGASFYVMEDAHTAGRHHAAFLHVLGWAGWKAGESHLETGGTSHRSWERRIRDALLQCHYVSATDPTGDHLDNTLLLMECYGIRHLWGYPGGLYDLAERARKLGWNRPMQSVVSWGDSLYPHYRASVERVFAARVFDTYGCGEGVQIAAQCGYGTGYHLHSADAIVEFVGDDGAPAPPGETAHLIVTRLHPGPMPLIRYRVGDLGTASGPARCACGRGFDLLASIEGRETDVVVTPSGNRLVVHCFTAVMERFREIGCFQVRQYEPAAVVIRLVPAAGCRISRKIAGDLLRRLGERGMRDMRMDLEIVAEIPPAPSGKRRLVVSDLASRQPGPAIEVPLG